MFERTPLNNKRSQRNRIGYHRAMNKGTLLLGIGALALLIPACSKGPTVTVVAVGKVGSGLTAHAGAVPQGAVVCAYKRALEDPRSKDKTTVAEACKEAATSDELWQRSMGVLAAYSENIAEIASGTDPGTTGRLEAELTGIRGPNWIEVGGDEKGAREAVTQLVGQLAGRNDKSDLKEAVKIAAPHVKTICSGLNAYLERQKRDLADLQKDIEDKRTAPTTRRCAMLDNRSICVSDSVSDSIGYANALGDLAVLEDRHANAQTAMKGFCAAHEKLAEAAENNNLRDEKTYQAIVDAVRAATGGGSGGTPAK